MSQRLVIELEIPDGFNIKEMTPVMHVAFEKARDIACGYGVSVAELRMFKAFETSARKE